MFRSRIYLCYPLILLLAISACTVQPLYSSNDSSKIKRSQLSNVTINAVDSRVEQVARDKLIFLLNGGNRQPEQADYNVTLDLQTSTSSVLRVQNTGLDSDTTASRVQVTGTISLIPVSENAGKTKRFKRTASALFDASSQQFANDRAEIDAQNRAAEQIAEEFRTIILATIR